MHQTSAYATPDVGRRVVEMFPDASVRYRGCKVVARRSASWGSIRATLETFEAVAEHLEIEYRGARDRIVAVVEAIGGRSNLLHRPCVATPLRPSLCFLPGDARATAEGVGLKRATHLVLEFDDQLQAGQPRPDGEAGPIPDERLGALCHLMAAELDAEEGDDTYVTGLAWAATALVERHMENHDDDRGHCTLAPWRVRRVRSYLEEHLDENVPIQTLADVLGLSRSHFARAFKASFGMTPRRWVMVARVERAKELLLEGRFSAAEIAVEVGFLDQSHFTRTFTRCTGASPIAWLNSVRD